VRRKVGTKPRTAAFRRQRVPQGRPRYPKGEQIVPVGELVHSSKGEISEVFDDGKLLKDLVDMLVRNQVDPLRDAFLLLQATEVRGNLVCSNNRRLRCLKEYHAKIAPQEVQVRVQVDHADNEETTFLSHFTTKNDGESVAIRRNARDNSRRHSQHAIKTERQRQNHRQQSWSRQHLPARQHDSGELQEPDRAQNESMQDGEEQNCEDGEDYFDDNDNEGFEEEDECSVDEAFDPEAPPEAGH